MTDDSISYYQATNEEHSTGVTCPKCGNKMTGGAVTRKTPGRPEMVTIRCDCGHAIAKVVKR